jgi:hypothetical protein
MTAINLGSLLADGRWVGKIFSGQWVTAQGGARDVPEPATGAAVGGPADVDEYMSWQWVTIKDTPPTYPF